VTADDLLEDDASGNEDAEQQDESTDPWGRLEEDTAGSGELEDWSWRHIRFLKGGDRSDSLSIAATTVLGSFPSLS